MVLIWLRHRCAHDGRGLDCGCRNMQASSAIVLSIVPCRSRRRGRHHGRLGRCIHISIKCNTLLHIAPSSVGRWTPACCHRRSIETHVCSHMSFHHRGSADSCMSQSVAHIDTHGSNIGGSADSCIVRSVEHGYLIVLCDLARKGLHHRRVDRLIQTTLCEAFAACLQHLPSAVGRYTHPALCV